MAIGGNERWMAMCGTRMEFVRWVIVTALLKVPTFGATTTELTTALIREDGALSGSLRENFRAARSERDGSPRQEVRAALATLLLDELVRNPDTGRHPDVWHLTKAGLDGQDRTL